jgi:hypothetical protein
MFGLGKHKQKVAQTPIGAGICHSSTPHGDTLEVSRFHRGSVIVFQWPVSHPKAAQQVVEVARDIQIYIDRALDAIDADDKLRQAVIDQHGVYPDGVDWFNDECDFTLTFGYADWPDGTLGFGFRDGKVLPPDVSD